MLKERGFYRGVNLGGWLSQCDYSGKHLDTFITEADFRQIACWGFDHVRLPVDNDVVQNPDGSIKEDGLSRVDRALEWAADNGLNVVLDLHKTQGYSFDPDEGESGFFESEQLQTRFYSVWECFAARYGSCCKHVMFDLLNEVTEDRFLTAWKRISKECVRRIRCAAPEIPVLLGGTQYSSARTLPALDSPYDANTLYNIHFYEPHDFTHQGAYWEAGRRDISVRINYAGSGASEAFFEEFLAPAIRKAEEEHAELYCGEYGVIDVVPPEEALKWFRDLHAVFERHGIGRCLWTYKQKDFGLCDSRMDPFRDNLLSLL